MNRLLALFRRKPHTQSESAAFATAEGSPGAKPESLGAGAARGAKPNAMGLSGLASGDQRREDSFERLLVAGGGTGGHVYPLLAVLETLREVDPRVEVLFLGGHGNIEERLAREHGVPFSAVPVGAVVGQGPVRLAKNLVSLAKGIGSAMAEVRRFAPDVVLVTGGYVSVPAAVAGWLAGRPVVVCLPDMMPGLAVKGLARLATTVTVSFPEVQRTLPAGKTVVTGYPVRPLLEQGNRLDARDRLGLPAAESVVTVFGGSRGARTINDALLAGLSALLPQAHVLHVTGTLDYDRVRTRWQALDTCARERYRIYSYVENEMADLLWAADLVVARAGAATLGEFPVAGVPSILVPYPYAGGHQRLNATYLRDRGAALIVEDADLGEQLAPAINAVLADPQRLSQMAQAAKGLAKPGACRAIVRELQRAAESRRP